MFPLSEDYLEMFSAVSKEVITKLGLESGANALAEEEALASDRLGIANIVGIALGEKVVDGRPQGIPAIQILVVKKAPRELVDDSLLAEELVRLFFDSFGAVSDVIEVGRPTLFHHVRHSYTDRVPGGASISSTGVPSLEGTLGAWLTDNTRSKAYLMTCAHCLGGVTNGPVLQPAKYVLQPVKGRKIAKVSISLDTSNSRYAPTFDVAIAEATSWDVVGDFVLDLGQIRGTKKTKVTGTPVTKYGAITHLTHGSIAQIKCSLRLLDPAGHSVLYRDQIGIWPSSAGVPFASSGDSGAMVVDADRYVRGILVGGEPNKPCYICTPINDILKELAGQAGLQLQFISYL